MTADPLEAFRKQGYFIVDDAAAPERVDGLEAAARRVRDKVRADEVDILSQRSDSGEPQVIWGLVAPEFGEPAFADYMVSQPLLQYVQALLGPQLRLGGTSMFCNGSQAPYDTGWHRDMGGQERDASPEEELELLGQHRKHYRKWHLALADDPCLWIVPGSHRRARTEREREVMTTDKHASLPGEQRLELKRGQTLFWNGNMIHRGRAPEDLAERMSIVAHMERHRDGDGPAPVDECFRWMLADNVRPALPEKMLVPYDRWYRLQQA